MALEDLARKGVRKYKAKIPGMESSYAASESRAKKHYGEVGFGPTRTGNYDSAWEFMPDNYREVMKPAKGDKWKENWLAKMRE